MKRIITILSATTFLLICSCGDNSRNTAPVSGMAAEKSFESDASSEEIKIPADRKIIREGDLTFETSDIKKTKNIIIKVTRELDGYITKETSYDYPDRIQETLIIRVSSDRFDSLVTEISQNAKRIESKNISSRDVTEEYIDVEARVKTKKELEARYMELLRKASSVEEMLSIEREMGKLREEIESVEGRLKYLNDRVSFSSLTVSYYQKISSEFGFWSKLSQSLEYGWKGFLWFLIGFVSLWPFIVVIVIVILSVIIIRKKKKDKRQTS